MWWEWQGDLPKKEVIEFMKKNYPPSWTYADFAAQFRAELFGTNERTVLSLLILSFRRQ